MLYPALLYSAIQHPYGHNSRRTTGDDSREWRPGTAPSKAHPDGRVQVEDRRPAAEDAERRALVDLPARHRELRDRADLEGHVRRADRDEGTRGACIPPRNHDCFAHTLPAVITVALRFTGPASSRWAPRAGPGADVAAELRDRRQAAALRRRRPARPQRRVAGHHYPLSVPSRRGCV
jgi:hypothetical protein